MDRDSSVKSRERRRPLRRSSWPGLQLRLFIQTAILLIIGLRKKDGKAIIDVSGNCMPVARDSAISPSLCFSARAVLSSLGSTSLSHSISVSSPRSSSCFDR